jgi:hypothetical protein
LAGFYFTQLATDEVPRMWRLICQDTFGFGEDRDPPHTDASGEDDEEGFYALWKAVIEETLSGDSAKPVVGFARFTLMLESKPVGKASISIDERRFLSPLAQLKSGKDPSRIRAVARSHLRSVLSGSEAAFWQAFGQPDSMTVQATAVSPRQFATKVIKYSLALVVANALFVYSMAGMVHARSSSPTWQVVAIAIIGLPFFLCNVVVFSMRELFARFTHPTSFFVQLDATAFVHSSGSFIKRIPAGQIAGFKEEQVWSRSGVSTLFVVEYREPGSPKPKQYSFYKALSARECIYDVSAEQMSLLLKRRAGQTP